MLSLPLSASTRSSKLPLSIDRSLNVSSCRPTSAADALVPVLRAERRHQVRRDRGDVPRAEHLAELLLVEHHALQLEQQQRQAQAAAGELAGGDLVAQVDRRLPVDAGRVAKRRHERDEHREAREHHEQRDAVLLPGALAAALAELRWG
jgi:hypothetical protein